MPSAANGGLTEAGCASEHDTSPDPDVSKSPIKPQDEGEEEGEEDEEEDVDFNPFLKGTPSPEASSSLSSEIVGDSDHAEGEIMMEATVSPKAVCQRNECQKDVPRKTKKRKSVLITPSEGNTVHEKENGSTSSGIDVNEGVVGDVSNTAHPKKPVIDLDDEDAICRRTRARYSLASFTLDELEAFLQETDDDDDLQNVDDEEEYRKFLAAVLKGEDYDGQSTQENGNIDDEDEDNDADFEIELEEMLESDYDEGTTDKAQKVRAGRRPETRQNRRQKSSTQYKKKLLEQGKRPLRPILPVLPNGPQIASFPTLHMTALMPETTPTSLSSTAKDASMNGFTPHQIGQLYCLMHEHVQLLIQVFSLCILDPSRQHIASQVQGLICEMLQKRDEVTAFRSEPYPDIYFRPPYTYPSVSDELPQIFLDQGTFESPSSFETPGVCSLPDVRMSGFHNTSSSEETRGHVLDGQADSIQTVKGSFWVPSVSGPILSVLDVAPLNIVGKYIDDVYTAVRDYRKRCVESSCDVLFEREPLFASHSFASLVEANDQCSKGRGLCSTKPLSSSTSQQPQKKSLAAALVESTKKESVALVPREISKLAQRFYPLFNPSLFPHKSPPVAVANRVLFTDAEDELLALGMMEYNTDWKAIQQRFLPCKSKHQIFVRQKNRCSSKAPENPIKAVRRMKTSPLTAKEIECIQEGLKVYKLDWMSVWKFVVPHRDPTLLRRQWRIALGTQKCYKQDAAKKEKRRLYELKRRCRTADLANWHLDCDKEGEIAGGDNNSGDDYIENADEGYVHEAFLADWRPGVSGNSSSGHPCSTMTGEGNGTGEKLNIYESGGSQPRSTHMHEFPWAINYSQLPYGLSHFPPVRHFVSNNMQLNRPASSLASKNSKSQVCLPPYRARRSNNVHLVKLAPDLPPVNLPPSVRVISQSALKNVQHLSPAKVSSIRGGVGHSGQENAVPLIPHFIKSGTPHLVTTGRDKRNAMKENITNSQLEESHILEEERGTESDLQMHPLLFQAPENGRLPYYPLSSTAAPSSSFSFFSANQPQLNLSLFHNPRQVSHAVSCFNESLKNKDSTSLSCAIDFHPLLKRTEDANNGGPSRSIEKSNELDLEIHLSSSSTKGRALGSRGMTAQNTMSSRTNVEKSGDKMKSQNTSSIYYQDGENCSKVVPSAHLSVVPSSSNNEDVGDNSLPGIVMEEEELSDSDEEIEEHVEFECEEMTDSEGEESSGCEQVADMPDKDVHSILMENPKDGDGDDQHEPGSPSHAQGSVCVSGKGSPSLLKLGLTNMGKGTSSSWLSLNSCTPGRPTRTKLKNIEGTVTEGHADKNVACRPNRSFKKTTQSAKKVAVQKHAVDVAQQLSRTVRKPRKRACRTSTSLNIGATTGSSTVDSKDELG